MTSRTFLSCAVFGLTLLISPCYGQSDHVQDGYQFDLEDFLNDLEKDVEEAQDKLDDLKDDLENVTDDNKEELEDQAQAEEDKLNALISELETELSLEIAEEEESAAEQEAQSEEDKEKAIANYETKMADLKEKEADLRQRAKEAEEKGLAELAERLSAAEADLKTVRARYEAEMQTAYENLLKRVVEEVNTTLSLLDIGTPFESDFIEGTESPSGALEIRSTGQLGLYGGSSNGYQLPISYAFNSWFRAGVAVPISGNESNSALIHTGLFNRNALLDFVELRVQMLADDDPLFGYGIAGRQRFGPLGLSIDWAEGEMESDFDYQRWKLGLGWFSGRNMTYLVMRNTRFQQDSADGYAISQEYSIGKQWVWSAFGMLPLGMTLDLMVTAPQSNELFYDDSSVELDGAGWRWQLGLAAPF